MFITIITPCSRPHNLPKLYESINIPNYRWMVLFDGLHIDTIPTDLPPTIEPHIVTDENGIVGNPQRNYALDKVTSGWVYFLDDDTILHPDLYPTLEPLSDDHDFFHFSQYESTYNPSLPLHHPDNCCRSSGNNCVRGDIDTGQVMVHSSVIQGVRWVNNLYEGDGVWIEQIYKQTKSPLWIDKLLCIYNKLR